MIKTDSRNSTRASVLNYGFCPNKIKSEQYHKNNSNNNTSSSFDFANLSQTIP